MDVTASAKIATSVNLRTNPIHERLLDQLPQLIEGGLRSLLEDAISDPASGMWLSAALEGNTHEALMASSGSYEVRRSANRGVAGVVFLLSRLARFGYSTKRARDRVQHAIQWLLNKEPAPDEQIPGLHFGDAGVAVAIAEAISSDLFDRERWIDNFLSEALCGVLDWPDITHGAAGQGVAVLYCADRLQDSTLLHLSHRCAHYLIGCQGNDGSWEMPPGVDGMSGQILTGFAHGVSGIVYFLAEYARRFNNTDADKAWRAGAAWLTNQAIPTQDGEALEWAYSNTEDERWKWWCHGSPGIALAFLRLYEQTRNSAYADIATKALQVYPTAVRYPNLSQCHGLSGLGEVYLEAGRILGNQYWYNRAERIASTLIHLGRRMDGGSVSWLVEDLHTATPDLMVGSSGVLHFLLRCSLKGEKCGFPLLLDPVEI
jgi:hypothetical protein